jgi:photosystem II stability/assembly factor-like uncharacterized protein
MDSIAMLSPNGQPTTHGPGPATELLVATLEGVVRLTRPSGSGSWRVAAQSLPDLHVSALVREEGSGKLFASAHGTGGAWVSDDGMGATWRRASNGIDRPNLYSLAARRVGDAVTLFAGAEPAALYRSDDLGQSWRELPALRGVPGTDKWSFPPPPHLAHVKCITLHPSRPATLYACVEQGALLKSEDDGESWSELAGYVLADDMTYHDTHRIEIHPRMHDTIYLTTGLGMNRSDDGGKTWRALSRRSDRLGYPDFIALDPQTTETVLMAGAAKPPQTWAGDGANPAVLKSTDSGRTWREPRTGLPTPIVGSIEALSQHHHPDGTTLMFATGTGEVYASEDAGESWTRLVAGLAAVSKAGHYRAFLPGAAAHQARQGMAAFT